MPLGRPGPAFTGKSKILEVAVGTGQNFRINGFWIADAAKDDFVDFLQLGEALIFWVSIFAVS
jgi:hypothetical protein